MRVRTSVFPFAAIARAQILGESAGVVKFVTDADGKMLGAHILGPRASDLIAELTLGMQLGASAADIARHDPRASDAAGGDPRGRARASSMAPGSRAPLGRCDTMARQR